MLIPKLLEEAGNRGIVVIFSIFIFEFLLIFVQITSLIDFQDVYCSVFWLCLLEKFDHLLLFMVLVEV